MRTIKLALLFTLLAIISSGCKTHWTKAVKWGAVPSTSFEHTVDIDISSRLIFVPVEIRGTTYRFLYDSGAPCSISKELQEKFQFKHLKSGNIRDTDNNKAPIEWALIDTFKIGELIFENQPAFVGDFTANPVLACFNADGIIGSNNIKFCNWIIDVESEQMTMTNSPIDSVGTGYSADFTYDRQYNITLPLKIGNISLKHVHLDYGSNGNLNLSVAQFDTLAAHNLLDSIYVQAGVRQTGILGKVTASEIWLSRTDTLQIGALKIPEVELRTGTSRIIGNEVLSNYLVSIDSEKKKIYFKPYSNQKSDTGTFGFQPGYSDSLNVYIQSVTTGSSGYDAGLKANMQILRIDTLDFENKHSICDYMRYVDLTRSSSNPINMRVKTRDGEVMEFKITKQSLFE